LTKKQSELHKHAGQAWSEGSVPHVYKTTLSKLAGSAIYLGVFFLSIAMYIVWYFALLAWSDEHRFPSYLALS
jgi:hypothetical protein